jgi:hypothetical protein
MAVVAKGVEQVAHRQPGDVDAERLVEPQGRALHEAHDHAQRHDGPEDHRHDPLEPRGFLSFGGGGIVVDRSVDQRAHEPAMLATRHPDEPIPAPPPGAN